MYIINTDKMEDREIRLARCVVTGNLVGVVADSLTNNNLIYRHFNGNALYHGKPNELVLVIDDWCKNKAAVILPEYIPFNNRIISVAEVMQHYSCHICEKSSKGTCRTRVKAYVNGRDVNIENILISIYLYGAVYDIQLKQLNCEIHHEGPVWDLRHIKLLTRQEHKEAHNRISGASHKYSYRYDCSEVHPTPKFVKAS